MKLNTVDIDITVLEVSDGSDCKLPDYDFDPWLLRVVYFLHTSLALYSMHSTLFKMGKIGRSLELATVSTRVVAFVACKLDNFNFGSIPSLWDDLHEGETLHSISVAISTLNKSILFSVLLFRTSILKII